MMLIETKRLRLRPFEKKDAEAFTSYRTDPDTARYQGWEADYSLSQALDFVSELADAELGAPGEWYQIAIAGKTSDDLVGDIGIHFDKEARGILTLGFTLDPRHQGNGYANEAITALLADLPQKFDLKKVCALTDVRNLASQKLLERLGFENLRTIKKSGFYKGEWCDEILYEYQI